MKLISVGNYNSMSFHTARMISAQVMLKPDSVLGLATGSSPLGAYQQIAADCRDNLVDFSQVRTVNLDEYLGLEPTHPQSYRQTMEDNLFHSLNIPSESIHIPSGVPQNLEKECSDYDALIQGLGGIDLLLLGIGRNGHIGFNEPSDSFSCGTHVVELSPETREDNKRFFGEGEMVPSRAITMGMREILAAKTVILIASGQEKREALEAAFYGGITPKLPASILQLHPNCVVIADIQAMNVLPQ